MSTLTLITAIRRLTESEWLSLEFLRTPLKCKNSGDMAIKIRVKLIYYEACLNQQDAIKREGYLKTSWGKRYIKNRVKQYLTG